MDDARRANPVGKQPWRMYPRQMLLARASAELARRLPGRDRGLAASEELEATPPRRHRQRARTRPEHNPPAARERHRAPNPAPARPSPPQEPAPAPPKPPKPPRPAESPFQPRQASRRKPKRLEPRRLPDEQAFIEAAARASTPTKPASNPRQTRPSPFRRSQSPEAEDPRSLPRTGRRGPRRTPEPLRPNARPAGAEFDLAHP